MRLDFEIELVTEAFLHNQLWDSSLTPPPPTSVPRLDLFTALPLLPKPAATSPLRRKPQLPSFPNLSVFLSEIPLWMDLGYKCW